MSLSNIKNKVNLLTIIYLLISIILMIISSPTIKFSPQIFFGMITYPFIIAYNKSSEFITNFFLSIKENKELKEENEKLKQEIKMLKEIQYNYDYILKENLILKNLLNLPQEKEYQSIIAKIIAKDPLNLYSTILINKGYTSGIKVGMPVYYILEGEKVVVGKIIEIGPYFSKIITIFDPRFYISVKETITNFTAICKGEAPKSFDLNVLYLSNEANIKFNSIFVTSGLGTEFPEGYKVGTVKYIKKDLYNIYQEVRLKPLINLSSIDYVFILLKESNIWEKLK
ncbi:MAG: rod shape-determining protein MreC [Spirochaetes bacterium]|nr:rod shape-determining protein MreC [Spirochaetota bacterium]